MESISSLVSSNLTGDSLVGESGNDERRSESINSLRSNRSRSNSEDVIVIGNAKEQREKELNQLRHHQLVSTKQRQKNQTGSSDKSSILSVESWQQKQRECQAMLKKKQMDATQNLRNYRGHENTLIPSINPIVANDVRRKSVTSYTRAPTHPNNSIQKPPIMNTPISADSNQLDDLINTPSNQIPINNNANENQKEFYEKHGKYEENIFITRDYKERNSIMESEIIMPPKKEESEEEYVVVNNTATHVNNDAETGNSTTIDIAIATNFTNGYDSTNEMDSDSGVVLNHPVHTGVENILIEQENDSTEFIDEENGFESVNKNDPDMDIKDKPLTTSLNDKDDKDLVFVPQQQSHSIENSETPLQGDPHQFINEQQKIESEYVMEDLQIGEEQKPIDDFQSKVSRYLVEEPHSSDKHQASRNQLALEDSNDHTNSFNESKSENLEFCEEQTTTNLMLFIQFTFGYITSAPQIQNDNTYSQMSKFLSQKFIAKIPPKSDNSFEKNENQIEWTLLLKSLKPENFQIINIHPVAPSRPNTFKSHITVLSSIPLIMNNTFTVDKDKTITDATQFIISKIKSDIMM